jgi:protein gp37
MSNDTGISWADATWPVTVGCEKVSAGCAECYAMRDARRMESNPHPNISSVYSGLVMRQGNGLLNWTGTVKTLPERLDWPANWREHRDVFVCSQSDLFHPDVPDAFIGEVFSRMWNYNWHTYYVLTKRPERLLALLEQDLKTGLADFNSAHFPHVMVGISAENQATANTRLPLLTQLPLASSQLFVSAEPLIGPLDLSEWLNRLGWVIAGGESGKHARPMHPNWPRKLRDQCQEAGIAYHFKQHGEWTTEPPGREAEMITERGSTLYQLKPVRTRKPVLTTTQERTTLYRRGRRTTGRVLDGYYWNARPGKNTKPIPAPHALGTTVTVQNCEFAGMKGTITIICPDDPEDCEFPGEEATYFLSSEDGNRIQQAFSYWQLQPI